jgi:hypothetical protein
MKSTNIFFYIAKTVLIIPEELFAPSGEEYIQIFLFSALKCNATKQTKFEHLNNALNNIFLTESQKESFLGYFCKFQKTLAAFSRLAYIYKFKQSKIVVNDDLGMNPIDIHCKDTICILQNKNKYLFRINDLINVIETSLTNSYLLFADPLVSKNPFNNVPFSKSTLYNIYFFVRSNSMVLPELFHKFFLTNFDLNRFKTDYEYLIREHAIRKHIENTDDETLFECANDMFYEFGYDKVKIDVTFPKKKLSLILRPYLMLYYQSKHSLIHLVKQKARCLLTRKLGKFVNFNPNFGRRLLKIERYWSKRVGKSVCRTVSTYNENHINFESSHNLENFLDSHLTRI